MGSHNILCICVPVGVPVGSVPVGEGYIVGVPVGVAVGAAVGCVAVGDG